MRLTRHVLIQENERMTHIMGNENTSNFNIKVSTPVGKVAVLTGR